MSEEGESGSEQQQEHEQPSPRTQQPAELAELSEIISLLSSFQGVCSRTRVKLDVSHSVRAQELLYEFSISLAYIPKSLQLLQDYRRFSASFSARAEQLLAGLRSVRGGEDTLSSEEQRVIVAVASLQETLRVVIGSLEELLGHARKHTQSILGVLSHDDSEGFVEFAQPVVEAIDLPWCELVAAKQARILSSLQRDVIELRAYETRLRVLREASVD